MDRSQMGSVGSASSKRFSSPKSPVSGGTDENLMDSSQNPQRPLSKHFVSLTKSSIPRKKILSDNNDIPFDIPPAQASLVLEDGVKRNIEKPSPIRSVLANMKSSKPYDPVTNYLSPRPKYLRYNPNRKRRFIDLQESKEGTVKDDSRLPPVSHSATEKVVVVDSEKRSTDTVISPAQDGIIKQENQDEVGVGDCDGVVERGKCCFGGVFKFLLLWTVLTLAISYMCSPMNNDVGLRSGNILLANSSFMNISIQKQSVVNYMNLSCGYRQVERRSVHSVLQVNDSSNDTIDVNIELLKKLLGSEDLKFMMLDFDRTPLEGDYKDTSDEITERFGQFQLREIPEIGSGTTIHHNDLPQEENEPRDSERTIDQDTDSGQESSSETEKAADLIDDADALLEIHRKEEENELLDSEKIVDQDNFIGQDSSSETEKAADLYDGANELLEILQKEEDSVKIGLTEDVGKTMEDTTSWRHESSGENEHNEAFHSTLTDNDDYAASWSQGETSKENEDNVASLSHETSEAKELNGTFHSNLMDSDNIECVGKSTETNVTVLEGITEVHLMALLLILAFSLLVYFVAHRTIQSPVKDSKLTVIPLEKYRKEIAAKQAPVTVAPLEEYRKEVPVFVDRHHLQEKVDTALKLPQTPVFMSEKAIFTKAPDVKLLGELVFDDVCSSHSRSYKRAKTTTDSNTSSRISSCYDNDGMLLPRGSVSAAFSSSVELSTTAESSPSRGSFTAEKKISKKQGSRDRSNLKNVVAATPVRRSSRIQKLAAISP